MQQEVAKLDDLTLIEIIKSGKRSSSQAMTEIINRHSGIFIEMINHFVPINSPYCSRQDMIEEKEFYIYKALLKFDPNKGTKFSTHLGNEAKWLCLNSYNKAKSKPLFFSSDYQYDKEPTESPHKKFIEEESFRKIVKIINDHPDDRVKKIFTMRYIDGEKNRVMPWKKISSSLQMSIQGCINIHNTALTKIKQKVNKDVK